MHAGLLHIFFNSLAIYVFGREIEAVLGSKKFLILFLSAGVIGGLVQELTALVWPDLFGLPVVGASAGAFGLVAAFAMLFPERRIDAAAVFRPAHPVERENAVDRFGGAGGVRPRVSRQQHCQRRAFGRHVDGHCFHRVSSFKAAGRAGHFPPAAPRRANWSLRARGMVPSGAPPPANRMKICPPTNFCQARWTRFSTKSPRTASTA